MTCTKLRAHASNWPSADGIILLVMVMGASFNSNFRENDPSADGNRSMFSEGIRKPEADSCSPLRQISPKPRVRRPIRTNVPPLTACRNRRSRLAPAVRALLALADCIRPTAMPTGSIGEGLVQAAGTICRTSRSECRSSQSSPRHSSWRLRA